MNSRLCSTKRPRNQCVVGNFRRSARIGNRNRSIDVDCILAGSSGSNSSNSSGFDEDRVRDEEVKGEGEEEEEEVTDSSLGGMGEEEEEEEEQDDTTEKGETEKATIALAGNDDYETMPLDIEIMLRNFCDKQRDVIWDPFVCNGFSTRYMQHLGYRVYTPPASADDGTQSGFVDFFTYSAPPRGVTCIVSNVPFSKKQVILRRLIDFGLPFCLLLPSDVLQRDYFTDIVQRDARATQRRLRVDRRARDRRRWLALLPNKTMRFHCNGIVQPLARFKSAFFMLKDDDREEPGGEEEREGGEEGREEEEEEEEDIALLSHNDPLQSVTIKVFDYDAMLRRHYAACKEIYVDGAHIGKRKR